MAANIINVLKQLIPFVFNIKSLLDDGLDKSSTKTIQKEVEKKDKKVIKPEEKKKPEKEEVNQNFFLPTTKRVTSNFCWRELPGYKKHFHGALDFSANRTWNYPCKAVEDGRVFKCQMKNGLALVAIVGKHTGCFHYYCHVGSKSNGKSNLVEINQHVRAGQVIGYCNRTGRTTGPHVHYAIYDPDWNCIDPMCFFKKFAPGLASSIINYKDYNQLHPRLNKTGRKCGVL